MHKYILITGLMGSGKSTIISEYMIEFPTEEFTSPPVEAKFRGMDFQFIDDIFGIWFGTDHAKWAVFKADLNTIYMSTDWGENWTPVSTIPAPP